MGHHQSKPKASYGNLTSEPQENKDAKPEVVDSVRVEKEGAGEYQFVCPFQEGLFQGSAHAKTEHDSHLTSISPKSPWITSRVFEMEKEKGHGDGDWVGERRNAMEYACECACECGNRRYYEKCLTGQREMRAAWAASAEGEGRGRDDIYGGGDRMKRVVLQGRKRGEKMEDKREEKVEVAQRKLPVLRLRPYYVKGEDEEGESLLRGRRK